MKNGLTKQTTGTHPVRTRDRSITQLAKMSFGKFRFQPDSHANQSFRFWSDRLKTDAFFDLIIRWAESSDFGIFSDSI